MTKLNLMLATTVTLMLSSASAFANRCEWHQWESFNGHCYEKDGPCSQYNYTNKFTCNNCKDNIQCDWNSHTNVCYPEGHYDGGGINPGAPTAPDAPGAPGPGPGPG